MPTKSQQPGDLFWNLRFNLWKIDWMVYTWIYSPPSNSRILTVCRDDPLSKIASWVGGGGEPKVYRKTLLVFSLKILLMPQKIPRPTTLESMKLHQPAVNNGRFQVHINQQLRLVVEIPGVIYQDFKHHPKWLLMRSTAPVDTSFSQDSWVGWRGAEKRCEMQKKRLGRIGIFFWWVPSFEFGEF